ncbi:hypothetical protein Emed_004842 [Eimeria media]
MPKARPQLQGQILKALKLLQSLRQGRNHQIFLSEEHMAQHVLLKGTILLSEMPRKSSPTWLALPLWDIASFHRTTVDLDVSSSLRRKTGLFWSLARSRVVMDL